MKESPTILTQATDYVSSLELKEIERLDSAARVCGCNSCVRQAEIELDRLTDVPDIDHEELLLINYALSQLKGKDE